MLDIPSGFFSWAGPVGVAALIAIIVMTIKERFWPPSQAKQKRHAKRNRRRK